MQASADEAELFRQALPDDVIPLRPSGRVVSTQRVGLKLREPEQSTGQITEPLSDFLASEEAAQEYLRSGINTKTLRQLKRGAWPPQDALDLHGLSRDAARALLLSFLEQATRDGLRCVAVIHGKGWRSEGREGILKTLSRHWLTQHPHVLAFCEAPRNAGGGGAVWVLLKAGAI